MKRIVFLDYVRVFACFLVMVVHASENFYGAAGATDMVGPQSYLGSEADRLWVAVYDGFSRMAVPLFMIVSAFLLAPMKKEQTMWQFYRQRAIRILPPFFIFMILYSTLPMLWGQINGETSFNDMSRILLNFPSLAGHLWFMYPLISLYLFIPIISPWLSKEDADWVVLGQPLAEAAKVTLDYKAPVAAVIMVLMVAMMVFDFIPVAPVTAVMIAGILMVLTGCFRNVEAAYKTINWESIVLIAAMLPMSLALEKTGASEYISNSLVSELGTYGPLALMAGIYFTTSLMTMFISNTATAVLLAPIAMQSATQIGVSPVPFLFAVTLGASMCFASPFSTPPNALVMPAGQYTFMDYVKVGLPLQIIMGIVMVLVLPLLFPF